MSSRNRITGRGQTRFGEWPRTERLGGADARAAQWCYHPAAESECGLRESRRVSCASKAPFADLRQSMTDIEFDVAQGKAIDELYKSSSVEIASVAAQLAPVSSWASSCICARSTRRPWLTTWRGGAWNRSASMTSGSPSTTRFASAPAAKA